MILTDPEWQAVLLSLKVSSLAVLFSLPFGIFFAWLLVRCTFPGKALLDSVLHLPLVLPPVVVGYLLLVSMGRRGFIGERLYDWFGITFAFSWRGAVLAAAVMSFPLMVRAIRLALEGVDVKLEQAARTLGAGRWRVFFTITLPLTLPGIIVGTVLAFARSLGEFGATITFVSNIPGETRTIPSAMYTLIQIPGGESGAARLCIISIALAMISLLISEWLARISRPELLLLDEPLASLDIPRKRELLPYLQRLTREINIPMLYVSHSLDEILHLADRVMVLENGQVKAFGALEEVWGSSVMNPWLPKEQQSSILKVTVLEHHPHYAMTALALGDQHLWVNKLDEPLQAALRIRIQASDVSLVLQPPQQISIRNVLRAKVVNSYDDNGQVEVELEVGGKTLWARISPWARDELAIKPGLWLYAQIKSVSITA